MQILIHIVLHSAFAIHIKESLSKFLTPHYDCDTFNHPGHHNLNLEQAWDLCRVRLECFLVNWNAQNGEVPYCSSSCPCGSTCRQGSTVGECQSDHGNCYNNISCPHCPGDPCPPVCCSLDCGDGAGMGPWAMRTITTSEGERECPVCLCAADPPTPAPPPPPTGRSICRDLCCSKRHCSHRSIQKCRENRCKIWHKNWFKPYVPPDRCVTDMCCDQCNGQCNAATLQKCKNEGCRVKEKPSCKNPNNPIAGDQCINLCCDECDINKGCTAQNVTEQIPICKSRGCSVTWQEEGCDGFDFETVNYEE